MKYELCNNIWQYVEGEKLFRIRALREVNALVKQGMLGGFVASEANLSQEGDCWISEDACAYGQSHIYENARVETYARVKDFVRIGGSTTLNGEVLVTDYVTMTGTSYVYDRVRLADRARVAGSMRLDANAHIYGSALLVGEMSVSIDADVFLPWHVMFLGCTLRQYNHGLTFFRNKQGGVSVVSDHYHGVYDTVELLPEVYEPRAFYESLYRAAKLQITMTG
jgi:carbonic anhydrase/acetyltransferase-like protein (isoleucine patch superfamily)